MNVLVTGGTGFIGKALVAELLHQGHAVTVASRDLVRARATLPPACQAIAWQPNQGPPPAVLGTCAAVIHLAGAGVGERRWSAARKRAIRDSRVQPTRALVEAIAAVPRERRPQVLISASAIGIYGDRGDEILDESSVPGSGFLAEVCKEWEREASAASALGMRTVMVRIGVVLGHDGGALGKMLPLFRLGVGGRLGNGEQWLSWIHREDLVRLFHFALATAEVGGIVNGVGPAPVTNRELTVALAATLHRPALLPAPEFALRLALGEMAALVLDSQRVLPRAAERLGFSYKYASLAAALSEITAESARSA
ncbi:MAG TPA: TIGR01777 family oxidoreductase [Terriglobales bacterium]|nr:TIGR01777 family oxidoreductase [Terriglobales bacterium]